MTDKEVVLDLSKKIKLRNDYYISLGSLLLSILIMIVQGLCFGWTWAHLLNFLYSLRKEGKEEKKNN